MFDVKHFSEEEFACPCCGYQDMSLDFVEELDKARSEAGVPFVISSGYRCEKHNEEVGGVSGSAHTKGLAVDIAVKSSSDRFKILQALIRRFDRIGISKNFIHVDWDHRKSKEVCWLYE